MSASQGLHFLRPFVFSPLAKKESAYTRFFSAACHISRRRHVCGSKVRAGAIASRRYLHGSAVQDQLQSGSGVSQDDGTPATATGSSHSVVHEDRIQKLGKYGALQYPRISSHGNRMSIPNFRHTYQDVTASAPASEEILLQGRIMSVRTSGSKLVFIDLSGDWEKVQVMFSLKQVGVDDTEKFKRALHPLLRGDIVSVTGTATRTSSGELSLKATALPTLLSPSLTPLPEKLVNEETKILHRHVDMLVNRETLDVLRLRSHIIKYLRDFFHHRDFLEVQTPMLADYAGGAAARPFLTSATEFPNKELALRIAPELWLKRLVVGGMNRVFEIGTAFRNEGIDTTHNPEFTMCESYSAYSNLQDLITMTETLIRGLLEHTRQLKESSLTSLEIPDLAPVEPSGETGSSSWAQVEFIPALEAALGITFPDLSAPDALEQLSRLLDEENKMPPIVSRSAEEVSLNKLLDHLASIHLEGASSPKGAPPLFITHHPACMAPLAKSFVCPRTGQLVSARAELFVAGREIANMYEEENDPAEQRRKFQQQMDSRQARISGSSNNNNTNNDSSDEEGQARVDESYIQALEHGLPPTGGWGCGVDRLVMLLSGAPKIGDVLSFGTLRNVVALSSEAARK
ncbi:mitochondrial lysine-tRNA synthetase [Diatrype stigma]|uniref:Lysyl-tRNA synthetase n=1 Tax=Diatrype stigma TaxID=117547 RepID=A0AAN9V4C9_9PEZI